MRYGASRSATAGSVYCTLNGFAAASERNALRECVSVVWSELWTHFAQVGELIVGRWLTTQQKTKKNDM